MGKGGLNRLLLTPADKATTSHDSADTFRLNPTDPRAIHIRTVLAPSAKSLSAPLTLRVVVEHAYHHDAAAVSVNPDDSITLSIPSLHRRPVAALPPVALVVAMQRPKVIARVLEVATSLGVSVICVVAAAKVEKSYWDCKLFRPSQHSSVNTSDDDNLDQHLNDHQRHPTPTTNQPQLLPCKRPHALNDLAKSNPSTNTSEPEIPSSTTEHAPLPSPSLPDTHDHISQHQNASLIPADVSSHIPHSDPSVTLPGRARGPRNYPHRDSHERTTPRLRRADQLPAVRTRLRAALEQANLDGALPPVLLERAGLSALQHPHHIIWNYVPTDAARVVAHPYRPSDVATAGLCASVARGGGGAVVAIGPEGGWTDGEVDALVAMGFHVVGLGERVLRSETAVIVALGLAHEGLRMREAGLLIEGCDSLPSGNGHCKERS